MEDVVKVGQYVVIQRKDFTKLHKITDRDSTVQMGRDIVELKNVLNQQWFKTYKMQLSSVGKKRSYNLQPCENVTDWKEVLNSIDSGADNRNINDDGQVNKSLSPCLNFFIKLSINVQSFQSQTLSNQEILSMREKTLDSKEIIGTLVANSKSFNEKTEFSQEKYIKKKEKKYFDFIQIRKPTIRLIADIFYRQDPEKPLGLRIDSLSQLISYSGVNSTGTYLLYEAGTSGLVPAALLNSMGGSGDARLIHIHPGSFPQKQAISALNLEEKHEKKCVSVNIYSVLRQYYQSSSNDAEDLASITEAVEHSESRKRKADDDSNGVEAKRPNLGEADVKLELAADVKSEVLETTEEPPEVPVTEIPKERKKPKWQFENEEAIELLKKKVDSLVIVSKEDPFNILKELVQFVHPGRPVVIFHTCKEILMECFASMKALDRMVNVRLMSNWMRNYQVLPMRTHPAVQITGTSGFLLVGYTVDNKNST